jgi:UDP-galactose transporter
MLAYKHTATQPSRSEGLFVVQEAKYRWNDIYKQLVEEPVVIAKLMVPSALYTVQNLLQFVAIENLHPASFQVLSQMKLLTTALVSFAMLNKQISVRQWISLGVLICGVSLVQLSGTQSQSGKESNFLGLISISTACWLSGISSVYFEKVLKTTRGSVWVRNVQLAVLGTVMGLSTVYGYNKERVMEVGFFHGYTPIVWAVIVLHALGGLLVAVVVKYADNMMKGVATSVSIVLSAVASLFLPLSFELTPKFVIGASLVMSASTVYSSEATFTTPKLLHPDQQDCFKAVENGEKQVSKCEQVQSIPSETSGNDGDIRKRAGASA